MKDIGTNLVGKICNNVVKLIHKAKQTFSAKLAEKLFSRTLLSKDWWSTLRSFILKETMSSIQPPLEVNNMINTDEYDKANILNNHFQSLTILDDTNAILPDLPQTPLDSQLSQIILIPQ